MLRRRRTGIPGLELPEEQLQITLLLRSLPLAQKRNRTCDFP
eukprot:gene1945-2866_t